MKQALRRVRPKSLRALLTLALTGLFLFGVIAAAVFFYVDTHSTIEELRERTLQTQARTLSEALQAASDFDHPTIPDDWQQVYDAPASGYYYTVYDFAGKIVGRSLSLKGGALPLGTLPGAGEEFSRVQLAGPRDTPQLTTRISGKSAYLVVSRDKPDLEALAESVADEKTDPLVFLLPVALLAGLCIYVLIGRAVQPMQDASKQAEAIGPANLDTRISTERLPAEVLPLAIAFNGALDRLAAAYEVERRITANAAHELRTPLTILSLQVQRALVRPNDVDWIGLTADIGQMQRVVVQLLNLARKEARRPRELESAPVNLSRTVRESAALLLPLVEAKGRILHAQITDQIMLSSGSGDDLRDLVTNLIENALVHGNGTIEVTLDVALEGYARLRVGDEGAAPEFTTTDRLFDRFQRGGSSCSSGAGLGLAIVRQVATNSGGSVQFLETETTTIEVRLPLSGKPLAP